MSWCLVLYMISQGTIYIWCSLLLHGVQDIKTQPVCNNFRCFILKCLSLPPSCAVVMKSGNHHVLEPSGPLQACNGTSLPYTNTWFTYSLIMILWVMAYRGGGLGGFQPPPTKISKVLQNRAEFNPIWKLLKIAEFRIPTPQDVRKKRQ